MRQLIPTMSEINRRFWTWNTKDPILSLDLKEYFEDQHNFNQWHFINRKLLRVQQNTFLNPWEGDNYAEYAEYVEFSEYAEYADYAK